MQTKEKRVFKKCNISKLIDKTIQYKQTNPTNLSIEELVINRIVYMAYNHLLKGYDADGNEIKIFPQDIIDKNVAFVSAHKFNDIRRVLADVTSEEWLELFNKYYCRSNNAGVIKRKYDY